MYTCIYVCMYVCTYVRIYVHMYVYMYVPIYVCIHVCMYVVCPKRKRNDFLFKCLLDSPEITSYLLQSMTLW